MSRAEQLHQIADSHGFTCRQSIDSLPIDILDKDFILFTSFNVHPDQDLASSLSNIMVGKSDGFQLWGADFVNSIVFNQNTFGHAQSVVVLRGELALQPFYLLPKRGHRFTVRLDHIGYDSILPRFRGYKKVKFSDCPPLNTEYTLWLKGDKSFQQLLSPVVSRCLEQQTRLFIEGNGNSLLFYYRWKKIKPAAFFQFIKDVVNIADLLARN